MRETPWWIAVHKPAGLVTDQQWNYPSVEGWVHQYLLASGVRKPYVGLVHRLDRVTSGVVLIAKRKRALQLLHEQFRERRVKKQYRALVEGHPPARETLLEHYHAIDKSTKQAMLFDRPAPKATLVQLRYRLVTQTDTTTTLDIDLLTGKYHQIRAQLAAIGHPVVGDMRYGATTDFAPHAIALQAYTLQFADPQTGEMVSLELVWSGFLLRINRLGF